MPPRTSAARCARRRSRSRGGRGGGCGPAGVGSLRSSRGTGCPSVVSGFGPKAARLAGRIGDGFVTMTPDADLVGAFRHGGGEGKKVVGGVKVCWSSNREKAVDVVHRLWPTELLPGELAQILPTPAHFEQASKLVTRDMVADAVTCGDDAEEHVETVLAYARAGFDGVLSAVETPKDAARVAASLAPARTGRSSAIYAEGSPGGASTHHSCRAGQTTGRGR
ncbi:LLM class flavin-dependent oxidoreductase [Kitasatospora sp. NPDC018058]|uniref:LLM class flavin-dependent oxidoreductase n=1 Tax=Kitasatospora sp. NPDC018058 TaxID=3364025 RepID=UPI0037C0695D